jgi:hypothetical protein
LTVIKKVSIFIEVIAQTMVDIQAFLLILIIIVLACTDYFYFTKLLTFQIESDAYIRVAFQ